MTTINIFRKESFFCQIDPSQDSSILFVNSGAVLGQLIFFNFPLIAKGEIYRYENCPQNLSWFRPVVNQREVGKNSRAQNCRMNK